MSERYPIKKVNLEDGASSAHLWRYFNASGFVFNDDIVLDLGCGNGYGSKILSKNAKQVIGYDYCQDIINSAKNTFRKDNIEFICNNLDEIELPECDLTVCLECLEHVSNPNTLAEKIKKATKRTIIISVPVIPTVGINPFHKTDFNEKTLTGLFNDDNWKFRFKYPQGVNSTFVFWNNKLEKFEL